MPTEPWIYHLLFTQYHDWQTGPGHSASTTIDRVTCPACLAGHKTHTCPDCGGTLDVEDTVMGERMTKTFTVRDAPHGYWRLRPVRAVFCCACEFVREWSQFMKENR